MILLIEIDLRKYFRFVFEKNRIRNRYWKNRVEVLFVLCLRAYKIQSLYTSKASTILYVRLLLLLLLFSCCCCCFFQFQQISVIFAVAVAIAIDYFFSLEALYNRLTIHITFLAIIFEPELKHFK